MSSHVDWSAITAQSVLDPEQVVALRRHLRYALTDCIKVENFVTMTPGEYKSMRQLLIGGLTILLIGVIPVALVGSENSPSVSCSWNAPDTGSPVHFYELEIRTANTAWDTLIVVPAAPGSEQSYLFESGRYVHLYQARVRGVDGRGRVGPWTAFSDTCEIEIPDPGLDE